MSKAEFLQELEKRLHVLNDKERQDVLEEYAQHIDLKIANGMSEEEAVKDFGSFDELVAELLDAYSINQEYASVEAQDFADDGKEKKLYEKVKSAVGDTAKKTGQAAQSVGKAAGQAGGGLLNFVKRFFLACWGLICRVWEWLCRPACRLARRLRGENRPANGTENGTRSDGKRRDGNGLIGRFWRSCMRGAGRLWRFSVRAVKFCAVWCIKFAFLCCAAPFLLCGLFFLFCAGLFLVLAAQGYPVIGVTVVSVGVVLAALGSVGILLSWVFTGKKKVQDRNREEGQGEWQEHRGEEAK